MRIFVIHHLKAKDFIQLSKFCVKNLEEMVVYQSSGKFAIHINWYYIICFDQIFHHFTILRICLFFILIIEVCLLVLKKTVLCNPSILEVIINFSVFGSINQNT